MVAAARAASAEAAAAASAADAAYARGKAARLAAAGGASRGFRRETSPERVAAPSRGRGRRAGVVAAAATRRSRRLRVLAAANADSDSDSSSDVSSDGHAGGKENGERAKHETMAFGAGPAFSFGARTSPVPGASLWWGPGAGPDASPGPGAYGDPESRLARHVPAVTFGKPRDGTGEGAGVDRSPAKTKPPSAKKSRGVWDPLGAADPDAPGPGHYYDPARSPSRVGASGPKFSFGGGKDDIGKLRAPGPHDTPGPGAYHDSAGGVAAGAAAGSPGSKKFTFGGRVGPDWASSGPGKDAPAPGSYFRDLDVLGRNVRDSANGARGVAPSFTFGGGPLREEKSAAASRAVATPGPGEYDGDGDGDARDPSATDGRSPSRPRPKTGFTFGFRRDEEKSDARASTPGPGAYDVPGSLPKQGEREDENEPRKSRGSGPAFTLAKRLPGGAMDASRAGDTPGPGEYDAARPGEGILGGGPAFTMGGAASPGPSPSPSRPRALARTPTSPPRWAETRRRSRCRARPRRRGRELAASVPGPGAYDVVRPVAGAPGSPADGAGAASARSPGPTLKGRGRGPRRARGWTRGEALSRPRGVRHRRRRASFLRRAGVHHGRASRERRRIDAHETPGPGSTTPGTTTRQMTNASADPAERSTRKTVRRRGRRA